MKCKETYQMLKADMRRLHETAAPPPKLSLTRALLLLMRPELTCLLLHRLAHYFFVQRHLCLSGLFYRLNLLLTSADIHPRSQIGSGCLIAHTIGLVIDAKIGANATLLGHNIISPAYCRGSWSEPPVLGDGVVVCAKSLILGAVRLADRITVAPYSVIEQSVEEPDSLVNCVPGNIKVVAQNKR